MSDFPEKETENTENTENEFSTVFSDPTEHKSAHKTQKRKRLPVIIASLLAVAVLAGGTAAVIKLIPEKEESTSSSAFKTIKVLELKTDELKTVTVTNKNGEFKLYSVKEESESSSSSSSSRCCSRSSYSCFRRSTISSVSRNRTPLAADNSIWLWIWRYRSPSEST